MKKTYICPKMDIVMLQTKATYCAGSLHVGEESESGSEQLSKKFWGNTAFDEEEESEENSSWY